MADVHGSPAAPGLQMPQAASPGPAAVPYAGQDLSPEPPDYSVTDYGPVVDHPLDIVHNVFGPLVTTQDPAAHDVNGNPGPSGLVTPYYAGAIDPVDAAGDNDPGGRSDVAATVAQAVANATDRYLNLQTDTYSPGPVAGTAVQGPTARGPQQQGSVIGDLMQFPPAGMDPGAGVGNTLPTAAFYDPPRGGAPETFTNTGNEPAPGFQGKAQ